MILQPDKLHNIGLLLVIGHRASVRYLSLVLWQLRELFLEATDENNLLPLSYFGMSSSSVMGDS